jgi:Domain of unknown function (DUF4328)
MSHRRDVRYQAFYPTIWMLSAVIALDAAGAVCCTGNVPTQFAVLCLVLWPPVTAITAVFFLIWLSAARTNTATYQAGGVGPYRNWTVSGWFCPVANLWVPYRILADILRASAQPTALTPAVLAAPERHRSGITLLRWWCLLWHATWASLCCVPVLESFMGTPLLAALVFQVLSLGAAACAIGIVVTVTRLQVERAGEPYFQPERLPRAAPRWFWLYFAAGLVVVLMLVTRLPLPHMGEVRDLFVL